MTSPVRTAVVVLSALLLQLLVGPYLTVHGAQIDLLLTVAIAAGLAGGPERGAQVGFVAGLLWDLTVEGPFGLSALAYCLAGYFVGSAQRSVVGPTWWAPIPGAAMAAAAAVAFYAGVGVVLGNHDWLGPQLAWIVAVVAVAAAVLALPAIRIMGWTEGEELGLRLPAWRPRRGRSFSPRRGPRRALTTTRRR